MNSDLTRSALRSIMEKRDATRGEVKALAEAYLELESVITWETTCGNCARLLDSSIKAYEEGYRAGVNSAAAGALERLNDSDIETPEVSSEQE